MSSLIKDITKEELILIISESTSLRMVLKRLGLSGRGHSYDYLKARMKEDAIEYKVILGSKKFVPKFSFENIFCNPSKYMGSVKSKVLELKLFPYICSECGNNGTHNGKKLVLQLDHIDGNSENNLKENLRFLCPNCHSQTETYSGKKTKKNVRICSGDLCNNKIDLKNKSGFCIECLIKTGYRKTRIYKNKLEISKDDLFNLIQDKSYREISKIIGVSDVTVKKYCIKYGLI